MPDGRFKAAIDQAVFPGAKALDLGGDTGVYPYLPLPMQISIFEVIKPEI
jgi:hypothetical protein